MNENPFNDYYDADNYYEEESNSDLESRLYANIHYASVENETHDETLDTSRFCSTNTENINDTAASNNNEQNASNTNKCMEGRKNTGSDYHPVQQEKEITDNEVNRTLCIEETCNNNKDPYVFDTNVEDHNTILPRRTKKKRKRLKSHEKQDAIKQQLINFVFKTPNPLPISSQVSNNSKNQQKSNNHNNPKNSYVSNTTTSNKKYIELPRRKQNTENVFKKYQKSKESLNKAYTEKHKEIEGMNTKYDVIEKKDKGKLQGIEQPNNAKNVDSDSDSDQSILEIPVPPKPPPPIINLNDSDEDIEPIHDEKTIKKQPLTIDNCNTVDFRNQVKKALSKSQSELISVDNANTSEDIILNCTEVQKGASSINEIREMSKDVQKKRKSHASKEKDSDLLQDTNKNKSRIINANSESLSNKDKRHSDRVTNKKTNNSMRSNDSIEYNKRETHLVNTNVDFTEDVFPADEFIRSQNELNTNKKRLVEHQQRDNNVKRKKNNSDPCQGKKSTDNTHNKTQESTHKSIDSSFFHPMSEKLKAFYTDSRGQENFDVNEVQSKMSKDPQLWAILDEDLRPSPKKQRFWNVKCTRCQQHGHQRSNCPEPRRAPKCYMCGVEGHTEAYCPQKMCLTCGKRQGTFRKTCETCRTFYCTMCNAVGHKSTECPDLWRRYHQTTTEDNVSIPSNKDGMKPADLLFCCNCTKRGHDSSMCKDYRWSQHFPTPPFVSNYTDGPTYMEEQITNTNVLNDVNVVQFHNSANNGTKVQSSDDLLPFPKELLKKTQSKKKAFPQHIPQLAWENEHNIAYIIYHCGNFFTLENDGREVTYTITARKGFNTYHIMECRVVPSFLEKLLEVFRFEVKIYKEMNPLNEIILRIRTFANLIDDLRRFILYWLSLEDDEKDYVIFLDLPMKRTAMLDILNSQIKKLGTETGNATEMYDAIQTLKFELEITKDQQKYDTMLNQLQETQYKLLLILNDHPNLYKISDEIRQLAKVLERSTSEHIPLQQYLQILTVYNFLFIPHTPPKSFINKYGKKPKLVVTVPKNTQQHNSNNTVTNVQSRVKNNSTIPVRITNRALSRNNAQSCDPIEVNTAHENVESQIYMPPPQAIASSHHVRFDDNIDQNISENCKSSKCNDPSGTAMDQNEDFSNDFILNRNIVQYDTVSKLHDFLPIDTASEKYTNITVNVSNKNHTDNDANLKSNSKDNFKDDKCQNTNKYTNITVSVSNKDQDHTTTSFQSNMNHSKINKHQNSNKYTNITVSVSEKNQTHTAVSTVSNLNVPTDYSLQSNNTDNSKMNESVNNDDVVCIEIKKKVPNNDTEKQQQNQKQNKNKKNSKKKLLTLAEKQEKRLNKISANRNREVHMATKRRFKLIQLNQTIKQNLAVCSSNNLNDWKELSRKIMEIVNFCNIPHLTKAAKALKTKIHQNILSRQDVYILQRLANIELQHQNEIKKLYTSFKSSLEKDKKQENIKESV